MSEKSFTRSAVLALAVLLAGARGTAYGQDNTWIGEGLARMVEGARWRVGDIRINAAFTLANAGYDSDVYYGYLGLDPVPDWTLSASLPVQVLLPIKKNVILEVSDTPQYVFYLDTARERAWNNIFGARLHFSLPRIFAQAGGGISDVRRRFSPELDINVREKRSSVDGLIFWQAARATSFAVMYGRTQFDLDDLEYGGSNLAEMLNRNEDLLDVIAFVQPGPRWRPFLDGQYGIYTFTNAGSALRDAKSYGVFGGIEFVPPAGEIVAGTSVRGALRVGYLRLDIADPGQPDGSGFSGEADVTIELTRKTSVQALFSKGLEFSVLSGADFYRSTRYGGGLLQRLSRRLSLSYNGFLGQMSYPEEGGGQSRRSRYSSHALNLDFRLARYLDVSLSGTMNRRTVGAEATSLNRYFVGLSLTYGSPGAGMTLPLGGLVR